jgi:hypothetical protein
MCKNENHKDNEEEKTSPPYLATNEKHRLSS